MANLKGFKQVLQSTYDSTSSADRKGYLWLVRELSGDTVVNASVYFGNHKYADLNNVEEMSKIINIINSLGGIVDNEGNWVGFLPSQEILSAATSIEDALELIEAAVEEKVAKAEYEAKVAELENAIADNASAITENAAAIAENKEAIEQNASDIAENKEAIEQNAADIAENKAAIEANAEAIAENKTAIEGNTSAITENAIAIAENKEAIEQNAADIAELDETKANAADVYTKEETYNREEIDGKISGVFHFKGDALEIVSGDTIIKGLDAGDGLEAEGHEGWVFQIGDKEYVSNNEIWVLLGFNLDLSEYAKKSYVDAQDDELEDYISEIDSALTAEIAAREDLEGRVETLEDKVGNEELPEGRTVTNVLNQLVTITGDDVE